MHDRSGWDSGLVGEWVGGLGKVSQFPPYG